MNKESRNSTYKNSWFCNVFFRHDQKGVNIRIRDLGATKLPVPYPQEMIEEMSILNCTPTDLRSDKYDSGREVTEDFGKHNLLANVTPKLVGNEYNFAVLRVRVFP
jgi:hypothetical protein